MADLSTLTSRRRLPRDGTKRWTRLANGRGLGYRRSQAAAGTWYVRLYVGGSAYRMTSLGTADDEGRADGRDVLSYRQALEMAIQWEPEEVAVAERKRRALTVRDVVARYLEWYEAHRKAYEEVRNLFNVHVLPELGDVRVDRLTADLLRRWHQGIAAKPARLRGGQTREAKTDDQKRARKVTANHVLTALKAALNRAVEDGVVPGPGVWAIVKPFRGVDVARARYLEPEEVERLLNVCPLAFGDLVTAALHTGARYGELAALSVGDYQPESGSVYIGKSKTGAPRAARATGQLVGPDAVEHAVQSRPGGQHEANRQLEAQLGFGVPPPIEVPALRPGGETSVCPFLARLEHVIAQRARSFGRYRAVHQEQRGVGVPELVETDRGLDAGGRARFDHQPCPTSARRLPGGRRTASTGSARRTRRCPPASTTAPPTTGARCSPSPTTPVVTGRRRREPAAVDLSSAGESDGSARVQLLEDIRSALNQAPGGRLFTWDLLDILIADESRPWGEWKHGKPLSAIGLGRLLKPFGISPRKVRIGGDTRQGYRVEDLAEAFERYLSAPAPPADPEHPEQSNGDGQISGSPSRNTVAHVPGCEISESSVVAKIVPGVPARTGDTGGRGAATDLVEIDV